MHPFNYYAGFPGRKVYHAYITDSLLTEEIAEYQSRGYEYLIWTSIKTTATDQLADLDTPKYKRHFENAKEVYRITGVRYQGPDIVVFQIPPIQQHPLYLWFSPAISFRGYDLNQESFKPGDEVQLALYWMSAEKIKNNYIIFVHIISPDFKETIASKDEAPMEGTRPTWRWDGDMQFIKDTHRLKIPEGVKEGEYVIRIGMYDADKYVRVPITTPKNEKVGDTVVLQKVQIAK